MKKYLFFPLAFLLFTGCQTTSPQVENADRFLSEWSDTISSSLSYAGDLAFKACLNDDERKEFAAYLWAASSFFNSISEDTLPSVNEMNQNLKAFGVSAHSSLWQPVVDVVSLVWGKVMAEVYDNKYTKVGYDSAQILAKAAQKLASKYIPAK